MEDHFSINIAQCVRAQGERREYTHYAKVTLGGRTRAEAREVFELFKGLFPEPEWALALNEHVHRIKELRHSPPRPYKGRAGAVYATDEEPAL